MHLPRPKCKHTVIIGNGEKHWHWHMWVSLRIRLRIFMLLGHRLVHTVVLCRLPQPHIFAHCAFVLCICLLICVFGITCHVMANGTTTKCSVSLARTCLDNCPNCAAIWHSTLSLVSCNAIDVHSCVLFPNSCLLGSQFVCCCACSTGDTYVHVQGSLGTFSHCC